MILSDEEIKSLGEGNQGTWQDDLQFARAIESAVIAKLQEQSDPIGVVKEDCNGFPWKRIGYTCETDLARLPEGTFVYTHPPAPSAVEGYQLVPIEPTDKMLNAASKDRNGNFSSKSQWDSMLAAARSEK